MNETAPVVPEAAPDTAAPLTGDAGELHDLAVDGGDDYDASGYREQRAEMRQDAKAGPEPTAKPAAESPGRERAPDGTFAKPSRGRKRFEALTAEKEAAASRAEAAERRAAELQAALEAAKRPVAEPERRTAPEPAKEAAPAAPAGRAKPVEDEIGSKYASYADFVEDLADWKAEQRLAALNVHQAIEERFTRATADQQRQSYERDLYQRTLQKFPDFDQIVTPEAQAVVFPDDHWQAIITAPNAEQLLYSLAKEPGLARKVADSDPIRLGYWIASTSATGTTPLPASSRPVVSSTAPAPYQPVAAGSKTTTPTLSELAQSGDDYDASGYREQRARERTHSRR